MKADDVERTTSPEALKSQISHHVLLLVFIVRVTSV